MRQLKQHLDLGKVPPGKWTRMLQRTVAGLMFFGLGVFGARAGWSQWIVLVCGTFAAHIWSGQVVNNALRELAATATHIAPAIRGLIRAIRGKNGA